MTHVDDAPDLPLPLIEPGVSEEDMAARAAAAADPVAEEIAAHRAVTEAGNGTVKELDSFPLSREPEPPPDCAAIRRDIQQLSADLLDRFDEWGPLFRQLLVDEGERAEQQRLRQVLYEKLDASKNSFQLQLVRPFVMRLAAMHDLLSDFQQLPDLPAAAARAFDVLTAHLAETLAVQGIEIIAPAAGDAFDCTLHYVVKAEVSTDPDRHERITRTIQPGFAYLGPHDRSGEIRPVVLRPARVATWRYAAPAADSTSSSPSGEQCPDPPADVAAAPSDSTSQT